MSSLREQEIIYIKEKEICSNGYGCDCDSLHKVDCRNGLTIIAIGWTRGNKKALATIIPTKYWEKFRALQKFDYTDIAATHKIMKRDVGIAYIAMRKIGSVKSYVIHYLITIVRTNYDYFNKLTL